ncbi:MAG: hypothetical protein AAGD10_00290 [Myxococcota bacterium]
MMFEGLSDQDFDAFASKKWGSNVYTLERRSARAKLLALGGAIASLDEMEGFELVATEDTPSVANGRKVKSIAAVLLRDDTQRTRLPKRAKTDLSTGMGLFQIALHQQHAHLFCELDYEGLICGLRFPLQAGPDRTNVAEKLGLAWAREELDEMARLVPGETQVVFGADRRPLQEAAWVELAAQIEDSPCVFSIERRWPRTDRVLTDDGLLDELAPFLQGLVGVYRLLAWSSDNDHGRLATILEETESPKPAQMKPGDRVTILSGLFSGRAGYLSEVDAKGRAKVMVGPVSVTVPVGDLRAQ